MQKTIIAVNDNKIIKKLTKKINNYKQVEYREAIIEVLLKDKNFKNIIISECMPGQISIEKLINEIKLINKESKIIIILEKENVKKENKILELKAIFIYKRKIKYFNDYNKIKIDKKLNQKKFKKIDKNIQIKINKKNKEKMNKKIIAIYNDKKLKNNKIIKYLINCLFEENNKILIINTNKKIIKNFSKNKKIKNININKKNISTKMLNYYKNKYNYIFININLNDKYYINKKVNLIIDREICIFDGDDLNEYKYISRKIKMLNNNEKIIIQYSKKTYSINNLILLNVFEISNNRLYKIFYNKKTNQLKKIDKINKILK